MRCSPRAFVLAAVLMSGTAVLVIQRTITDDVGEADVERVVVVRREGKLAARRVDLLVHGVLARVCHLHIITELHFQSHNQIR